MRDIVREIVGICGGAAVTFGVYQLNHPAGWVVGGLLTIAWAFLDDWLD